MAGASDPLEDMLFNEVDEKAVSDLVGSLESQLGSQKTPSAPYSEVKREGPSGSANHFSGKLRDQVGSPEPQQGHPKEAGLPGETNTDEAAQSSKKLPSSTSSGSTGGVINAGTNIQTHASPAPGSVTLPGQTVPGSAAPNITPAAVRTASSPGLQGSLNGNTGPVKLVNNPTIAAAQTGPGVSLTNTVISTVTAGNSNIIVSMASQPNFPVASPTVALQRHPNPVSSVSQNGLDPKVSPQVTQSAGSPVQATTSQVMNPSSTLMSPNMVVQGQALPGSSVVLASTPPPVVHSPINQVQSTVSSAVTLTAGVKPAVNGVGQPTVTIMRPPGSTVMATSIQQQRPGLVASPTRTVAPQLAARPPQQTTIQLPPGFTIPPGMVLVRTETGQLVMVPQQVLAQAQAKTQAQGVTNISPRPATPTSGATIRMGAPSQAVTMAPVTMAPAGVKMAAPQKAQTVIAGGQVVAGGQILAKPAVRPTLTPTSAAPAPPPPQEMMENVKKCKNFLATLIKLASQNSPSPNTSKNVKGLVQDLLDAKIEPEEFTTRLQADLKSSPQPYLIPFLKKSLPALRLSLLNNQQSLISATQAAASPVMVSASPVIATSTVRARLPSCPSVAPVRTAGSLGSSPALGMRRPGVQGVQTRMPMVITPTIRPQGAVARAIIASRSSIGLSAQATANQKKLSDPGGGTFRDDDDINDVASMAGVNLYEENARILATSSELVGTKIRSCKDEAFLPPGLLHRRILETVKRFGVTEVPVEAVNFISHATQTRLRSILEKVTTVAQHRTDGGKDEEWYEQSSDVRTQLRFFEQLERMEKQRKDEQEREILLKAAKSRARQEDPEQARLKAKAKEMQQQEQAQIRQREANLTALAAIGPRKKRKLDSPGSSSAGSEVASGSGAGSSPGSSSRQQLRQRITRVNLRDLILCLEQERATSHSLMLYKALLK